MESVESRAHRDPRRTASGSRVRHRSCAGALSGAPRRRKMARPRTDGGGTLPASRLPFRPRRYGLRHSRQRIERTREASTAPEKEMKKKKKPYWEMTTEE